MLIGERTIVCHIQKEETFFRCLFSITISWASKQELKVS